MLEAMLAQAASQRTGSSLILKVMGVKFSAVMKVAKSWWIRMLLLFLMDKKS